MSELLWIAVTSGIAWLGWRGGKTGVTVVFGGLAALLVLAVARRVTGWLGDTGLGWAAVPLLLAGGGGIGWVRWGRSGAVVTRWGRRVRRKSGVASTLDIVRFGSAPAVRRQAATVRPSLARLALVERVRLATIEVAIPLCRAGLLRVWSSIEDFVVVFGGPRFGKSGWLACQIRDAAGAVIATSTRADLYDATSRARAVKGPVWVFNPTGDGPASTIGFNPVAGCEDPVTASERAEDMLPCGLGDGEREYWVGQARQAFAALLHAAALGGRDCHTIAGWIADPDTATDEVEVLMRRSKDESGAFATAATQFLTTNDRTRSSVTSSMRPALAWLTNPHTRAASTVGTQFDVAQLLAERGTLYLIGGQDGQARALLGALTGYLARNARRIAATCPKGRLDPQLTLALDEVKLSCPVPLDQWTADMGGRGVHIIACFQSRAQLIGLWGQAGAAEIVNNAGSVVVFGGSKDEADLRYWSTLFGTRDEPVATTGPDGQVTGHTSRQVPVFSPAQLAALPKFQVVVSRRYMAPVIGRAAMVWERPHEATILGRAGRLAAHAAGGLTTVPGRLARTRIARAVTAAVTAAWTSTTGRLARVVKRGRHTLRRRRHALVSALRARRLALVSVPRRRRAARAGIRRAQACPHQGSAVNPAHPVGVTGWENTPAQSPRPSPDTGWPTPAQVVPDGRG